MQYAESLASQLTAQPPPVDPVASDTLNPSLDDTITNLLISGRFTLLVPALKSICIPPTWYPIQDLPITLSIDWPRTVSKFKYLYL